jgi:hypothetical protein
LKSSVSCDIFERRKKRFKLALFVLKNNSNDLWLILILKKKKISNRTKIEKKKLSKFEWGFNIVSTDSGYVVMTTDC